MDTVEELTQILFLNDYPEHEFSITSTNADTNEPHTPPFRAKLNFGPYELIAPKIDKPYEEILPILCEIALTRLYPEHYQKQNNLGFYSINKG